MPSEMSVFGTQAPQYDDRWKFFFIRVLMKFGMKNPYEKKKVELSPDLLKDKAQDMRYIRSQYEFYIEQMRYLVWDLENLWQNDIQSSFLAELGNMQSSLKDYAVIIDEYASLLDFVSQELSLNHIKIDKPLSVENDEPVTVVLSNVPEMKKTRDDFRTDGPFGIPGKTQTESDKSFLYYVFKLLSKFGIKNPYETSKARLDPQELKNKALEMRSITSQYDYNVRKMQYIVEDLEKLWQNDAQSSILKELENVQSALKDYSNLADEFASLLEIAALELQTSNVDTDKASVLSDGTEGPVTVVLTNIPYLKRSRIDLKAYDPYFERTQVGVSTDVSTSRKNAEYIYNVYEDHIELVKYIGLKRTVEIPSDIDGLPVTHIGLDCFAMAWRVKFISITMPDSVTTVYHGAFRGCQCIRELKLSKNLKYIGNYAFAFLTDLDHIDLPENVVSFGMGAFRNCVNLKSVCIPQSTLLRIGNDCFYGCQNLESVTIGNDVVDIDDWAFKTCEHLTSVTMGGNVAKIGESAFYNCIRLTRLDLPETVSTIGDAAFYSRRGITLGVIPGSAAESYAIYNNLQFVRIAE